MIKKDSIIARSDGFEVTELGEEKVIMNLEKGKYFSLNEVGSIIWEIINKKVSTKKIIELLSSEYDVEENICEECVFKYLNDLENLDLVKVI